VINIGTEELLTLAQAAKILPPRRGGRKTHTSTLFRWSTTGVRGVRLETIQVGGCRCTTQRALQEFCEALTTRAIGSMSGDLSPRSSAARRRAQERADRELDAMGV
jgi:hypothetical protein